jgi:hypothetical protein
MQYGTIRNAICRFAVKLLERNYSVLLLENSYQIVVKVGDPQQVEADPDAAFLRIRI